ncbi:MAG: SulP family inorganic anion transporter [Planctomycetota bacterium]
MEPPAKPSPIRQYAAGLMDPIRIPSNRLVKTVQNYSKADFRGDAIAGITVAVVAVPQSMAYAIIAGVPPVYGIYTVILQSLVGAFFNSQKLLSVGPINTQSLLVASIVTRLTPADASTYLALVVTLTMMKGVMQMLMAALRLGNLVRYVSQSVIVGFTAGAGVLIAAGQVPAFLGYGTTREAWQMPGLIGIGQRTLPQLDQTDWRSVAMGVAALVVVIGSKSLSKFVPGPLIAVALTGVIVALAGWAPSLNVLGEIPIAWPGTPTFVFDERFIDGLIVGSLALALLGLMEAYSIGKNIATKTGDRISANMELFAQGVTNAATSLANCIPGSASFSRSALNHYTGARTIFSSVFSAAFVTLIFLLLAPVAEPVPMAAIAAILFVIAYGLIDWGFLRRAIRADRTDAVVCITTFAATLTVPLKYAVFVGIILNLALYLRKAAQLRISEMVPTGYGPFTEQEVNDKAGQRQVKMIQLEGDLFFALADELQDRLTDIVCSGVRVVIFRLKRTHHIDATCFGVLDQFVADMHAQGRHVLLCGVRDDMAHTLKGFGLYQHIGAENIFTTGEGANVFNSAKQALARAQELLDASIDIENFEAAKDDKTWSYTI